MIIHNIADEKKMVHREVKQFTQWHRAREVPEI